MDHVTSESLISGKLLAKNTVINIIGIVVPLLVASFSIPLLVKGLGVDRFGILSLAWIFIGYFNLFDLGLGRAVTQMISEKLGLNQVDDLPSIFWTAQILMLMMGVAGMLLILLFSTQITSNLFRIPAVLEAETLLTVQILSIIIPLVTSTTGLRGYLQAYQRFDLVNYIRIPFGAYVFLGPLAVLPFTTNLVYIAIALAIGRLCVWICYFIVCLRISPTLSQTISLNRNLVPSMLSYGGWMTITNVIGPLMVYFDRFIVGGLISIAGVTFYTIPQEIVTKIMLVPNAFMNVLFPAFAFSSKKHDGRLLKLLNRSIAVNLVLVFPLILFLVSFAFEILTIWLGSTFAVNGFRPLQWLAVGTFFNTIGVIPYALLQGIGRPDITAKLHLIELPLYFGLVYFLTIRFGLTGTAVAWTIRLAFDTISLLIAVYRLLPDLRNGIQSISVILTLSLLAFSIFFFPLHTNTKLYLMLGVLFLSIFFGYKYVIDIQDRAIIHRYSSSFIQRFLTQ